MQIGTPDSVPIPGSCLEVVVLAVLVLALVVVLVLVLILVVVLVVVLIVVLAVLAVLGVVCAVVVLIVVHFFLPHILPPQWLFTGYRNVFRYSFPGAFVGVGGTVHSGGGVGAESGFFHCLSAASSAFAHSGGGFSGKAVPGLGELGAKIK